ncbi:unnamed protein product [Cuscuta epithymum]|uniref:RanBP2-type domain-containing protein n=1 Tax=Cuscuta epithymum TaxID=186058 RepID=A0AAV0E6Z6_9ASTE|nr:unnamed protein product [Cuscuta epithymum]CAH9143969.1 unnamed protein product [Cuscuta epithymum]
MSASIFFGSHGASIFRNQLYRCPRIASPFLLANRIVLLRGHCSSASAADCVLTFPVESSESDVNVRHPWPEWINFVDCLKTKGYLPKISDASSSVVTMSEGSGDVSVYRETNILKNAYLNFARDRFDILRMLPTHDMQAVVQKGCPNLFRKAVNSAKRLRVYLQLNERHACDACNLRGSCDRANVILKESEGSARTVDIVRLLVLYALDPLVTSREEKPPPRREQIEASVRKLLLELVELSETPIDPKLTKPIPITSPEMERSTGYMVDKGLESDELHEHLTGHKNKFNSVSYGNNPRISTWKKVGRDNVNMKKGDWICSKCNFMNYAKNMQCLECKAEASKRFFGDDIEMRKGDWKCIKCEFINFASRSSCRICTEPQPNQQPNLSEDRPKRLLGNNDTEMRKGDWKCTKCEFINFASRSSCKRCTEPQLKRGLNPGEWNCPSCDFLNYRKNMVCKKCNHERPRELQT